MAEPDARVLAETDLQAARTVRTPSRTRALRHEDMLGWPASSGAACAQAAEAMRRMMLGLVLDPGADEARAREALRPGGGGARAARRARARADAAHATCATRSRTEAAQAAERATGELPGARDVAVVLRRPRRLHAAGRGGPARRARRASPSAWRGSPPTSWSCRCAWSRRSATRRCSSRPRPTRCSTPRSQLVDAADDEGEGFPQLRAGRRVRPGAEPRGRLVRAAGEPREPAHRDRPAGVGARHARGPRRRARRTASGRPPGPAQDPRRPRRTTRSPRAPRGSRGRRRPAVSRVSLGAGGPAASARRAPQVADAGPRARPARYHADDAQPRASSCRPTATVIGLGDRQPVGHQARSGGEVVGRTREIALGGTCSWMLVSHSVKNSETQTPDIDLEHGDPGGADPAADAAA